jgi:hypothetical protein
MGNYQIDRGLSTTQMATIAPSFHSSAVKGLSWFAIHRNGIMNYGGTLPLGALLVGSHWGSEQKEHGSAASVNVLGATKGQKYINK